MVGEVQSRKSGLMVFIYFVVVKILVFFCNHFIIVRNIEEVIDEGRVYVD